MKRLSLPEVEGRVRAALQARSDDCPAEEASEGDEGRAGASLLTGATPASDAATSSSPMGSLGRAPASISASGPPSSARRPIGRLVAATAAVVCLVAIATAAHLVTSSGGTDRSPDQVRSVGPGELDGQGELANCGHQLPVRVAVTDAERLVAGPAPGSDPPEPGQVVWHWVRPDLVVEARWPTRPQPLYADAAEDGGAGAGGDGVETGDGRDDAAVDDAAGGDGAGQAGGGGTGIEMAWRPRIELDVNDWGGLGVHGTTIETFPIPAVPQGCELVELRVIGGPAPEEAEAFRGGPSVGAAALQLTDPDPSANPAAYALVDLDPLVAERRDVESLAPDAVPQCGYDGPATISGGPDLSVRGASAAAVLQAFLATRDGAGLADRYEAASGWTELTEVDGTVSFGRQRDDQAWNALVSVVPDENGDGWHLDGWRRSAC